MPYFDNSTPAAFPKDPSPTRAYQSYMCTSKCEYSNKNGGIENSNDKPSWVTPQSSMTQDKRLQQNISKLRDILSDTIASLTRENNLKKGESVELTLEIELVKSIENTPTHSLVEVTIIQHNNKGKSNNNLNKLPNKMLFKIEQDKPLESKPSLHKQQSWFKRVMSRENTVCKPNKELCDKDYVQQGSVISRKHLHKPLFCPIARQRFKEFNNPELQDSKSKFTNILPTETNSSENVLKGYQKIQKRERKQEPIDKNVHGLPEKVHKRNSLMRKISDIFLPSKKPSKNEVAETALKALKNEIDSMKTMTDEKEKQKHNQKRDKTPVQNLGKLVNNVLFDVMASIDGDDKNKIKEELKLPLQYKRFFEPVKKTNKKSKKLVKRKTSPMLKKLYRSHSDTCCMGPLNGRLEARVKSSNSMGDFSSHMAINTLSKAICKGDTKPTHKKKRKRSDPRGGKKNRKGEKRIVQNTSTEDDHKSPIPQQSAPFSRSSLIQWNGKYVKVSKDIKARIEMLIVNELENLALKEGMECDVTPLSSTEDTQKDSNTVEKISSFICELDISDKSVRRMIKSSKSLHRKVSVHPIEMVNTDKKKHAHKGRTHTTLASSSAQPDPILRKQIQSIKTNDKINMNPANTVNINEVNQHLMANIEKDLVHVTCNKNKDGVEIKYMNKNMQNWSAESQTTTIYSHEMVMPNQQDTGNECVGRSSKGKRSSNRFISTGFVKIIKSDDSTWNKPYPQPDIIKCDQPIKTQDLAESKSNTTGQMSSSTGKSSSKTSNGGESCIEIELDIQDLEYILYQAKHNYDANKVLIEAKCVHPVKKHKSIKQEAKNSPSYTNRLLTSAAQKLEKYSKTKTINKKSK